MSRIAVLEDRSANVEQKILLETIRVQRQVVPNFLRILAHSPSALEAFLGLSDISDNGTLDVRTRERIALALAQANGCKYCVSAHTAIGRRRGLFGNDMAAARNGDSEDAQAAVAVRFALSLMAKCGDVDVLELAEMRTAGYSDSDIVEVIVHVGMNFLTNILAKSSRVDIDFPEVALSIAA